MPNEKTFVKTFVDPVIEKLTNDASLREIPEIEHGSAKFVERNGRRLLNLASNNYLGLSEHPALKKAAVDAVERYGTSSGASRLVTGTFGLYEELESELRRFKERDGVLALGSGFAANLCILSSLADRHTVVFSDRLNHASIIDGITLSGARHVRYRHCDPDHLSHCLEKYRDHPRKLLVSDTVFSMDGDVAPLPRIVELCKEHGVLSIMDEAHATGIFGRGKGRGLVYELGLEHEVDVHMGTFSKAMGSLGAYIAADENIISLIRNKGRAFIYSTALPPAVVGANIAALRIAQGEPERAAHLLDISENLRWHIQRLGFDFAGSETQIIPIVLGDNDTTLRARDFLEELGILVGAIRPPTVPKGTSRLRASLRADITNQDMEHVYAAFSKLAQEIPKW